MKEALTRWAAIAVIGVGSVSLNGCLITDFGSSTSPSQTTSLSATVTMQAPSPCTVNTTANTTECKPTMTIGTPPLGQSYNFDITLLGYASALPLYDPLIVQVPSTVSGFSGSITADGGFTQSLFIRSGLQSIPIDANTSLTAEPGMQLLIIDVFSGRAYPPTAFPATYGVSLQFKGTASSIKVIFAGEVAVGAAEDKAAVTYYPPIFPCVTSMAQVPAIPLPTDPATLFQILQGQQGCVGKQYDLGGAAIGAIDVNQQGLTGSWFNQATNGQGIELEFFVNAVAPGTAYLQGAWFTFDVAAGGADHQRWYTFSGNAKTAAATKAAGGGTAIPVTIYQNTGGNFGAPPITNAVAVGTGTLTISDCTTGSLSYTFTDGSGRSGSTPLTRLTKNVTCAASGTPTTNADFGFTGNWYDATTSGQGFVIEVNPASGAVFVTWYTYAANGQGAGASGQRWFTAQGTFTAGMRSINLTLYETDGGVFNQGAPAPTTSAVGTATLTFTNCGAASLNYNFTSGSNAGHSGTIALSRVGPTPAGCGP
jgi:hypothetical protein